MLYKVKWKKVSFSMVCCHIEFLVTFLATYSRIPNKSTGYLLDNKKNPICKFSIKKLKFPPIFPFFLPIKKKVLIYMFIWNYTSIRNSRVPNQSKPAQISHSVL